MWHRILAILPSKPETNYIVNEAQWISHFLEAVFESSFSKTCLKVCSTERIAKIKPTENCHKISCFN